MGPVSRPLSAVFFFLALAILLGAEGSVPIQECPAKCEYRCSATSHKKPCLFFCNYCCKKCLCVPSGTSSNKEEGHCYKNWKTKEGGPKCP